MIGGVYFEGKKIHLLLNGPGKSIKNRSDNFFWWLNAPVFIIFESCYFYFNGVIPLLSGFYCTKGNVPLWLTLLCCWKKFRRHCIYDLHKLVSFVLRRWSWTADFKCPLQNTPTPNFYFELAPKKRCFRLLWVPLECVKIAFLDFSLLSYV